MRWLIIPVVGCQSTDKYCICSGDEQRTAPAPTHTCVAASEGGWGLCYVFYGGTTALWAVVCVTPVLRALRFSVGAV